MTRHELMLDRQGVRELPLDPATAATLEKISARENQLTSLPDALWELPRLRILSLGENPLAAIQELLRARPNLAPRTAAALRGHVPA